jgi:hypothetical protein
MDNQAVTHLLAGVVPTNERDLSMSSRFTKALPSFGAHVVSQLHPDMIVTEVSSAIEGLWLVRVIKCTDVNLSLLLSFPDSLAEQLGLLWQSQGRGWQIKSIQCGTRLDQLS